MNLVNIFVSNEVHTAVRGVCRIIQMYGRCAGSDKLADACRNLNGWCVYMGFDGSSF